MFQNISKIVIFKYEKLMNGSYKILLFLKLKKKALTFYKKDIVIIKCKLFTTIRKPNITEVLIASIFLIVKSIYEIIEKLRIKFYLISKFETNINV